MKIEYIVMVWFFFLKKFDICSYSFIFLSESESSMTFAMALHAYYRACVMILKVEKICSTLNERVI